DGDRRRILEEREDTWNRGQLGPQLRHDLVHIDRSFGARLEIHENESLISLRHKRARVPDIRIALHDLRNRALMLGHGFKRNILACHRHTKDEAAVLAGYKSTG